MKRRTFDGVVTLVGVGLSIFLFIAAGLLNWGYSFANNTVKDQLVAQKIFFPPAGSQGLDVKTYPMLQQYGGMQMTTGKQAQMYADYFIAEHLLGVAGGKTYSEMSTIARANPTNAALQGQVATLFKGETLRSILLTAYAFWQLGQIARIGAGVALVGGLLLLLLSVLGWTHLRRTPHEATIGNVILPRTLQRAGS